MDYSTVLIGILKEEPVRQIVNPIVYFGLKLIYNNNFKKRSKYFAKAINQFYETLGNTLDISIFDESIISENKDMGETICMDLNNNLEINNNLGGNMNVSINKDSYVNMSAIFSKNWQWSVQVLYEADDEYILDKDDDYVLLKMLKNYIFSNEDPKTSQLLISGNIYASSIELIYCLKLAENFPKTIFNPREALRFKEYTENIKYRIRLFYGSWCKMYKSKYEKNKLIQELIGNLAICSKDENSGLDLISLSMVEPLLNSKYISFTKLIREGPFCFEIEEVARQISIIDHELISNLKIEDYHKYICKKAVPESFSIFSIREKQLKCYIILFIWMHNNLENKKNMIQNFISLAYMCKGLKNQQTCFTIISAFNLVDLKRKKLLWKLIEKKYREIFLNLEKDFNESEFNDNYVLCNQNINFPSVPHINRIKNNINNIIIKQKSVDLVTCIKNSKDFKDFYLLMEELSRNKYSFFKVNPLYDFFKFGFLEIFKPKKWNLKFRTDFSQYSNDITQLDQLLEVLIKNVKNLDN